jgi:DNA helicase-2/ATP-dependent DNA helicase PcrA
VYSELRRICLEQQGSGRELHFFTVDQDMKFFRRPVIKDILAFCRVVLNRSDAVSLSRIMINQVKGVGERTVEKMNRLGEVGISLTSLIDPGSFRDGDPYLQLMEAAQRGNIVVYDTETTGLDLARDQIIQISAIRLGAGGKIIGTLDQLVLPTVEISKAAERTHHMTMQDLLDGGGTGAREALQRFSAFVDGAVLVGHNSLRFDAPLVARQLRENGLPPLNLLAEYDTMVISKQFFPTLVNHRLATLCEKYGIVNENAHNALGDITATGKVLWHLLDECIIPTAPQRRRILEERLPRFSGLFQFIEELSGILAKDRVDEMMERIIDRCRLKRRFPEDGNQMALSDLLHVVRRSEYEDGASFLRDFLNDAALSGSQIDVLIRKLHKIPIITVHQAKGCEFDTVIIAGAEDDVFPSYSAKMSGNIEEEKRVFYVAISRAKKQLILISRSVRENRGGEWPVRPSPFIQMIPQETLRNIAQ